MIKPLLFELSEPGENKPVQVAKVGTFNHKIYGKIEITTGDLQTMLENFNGNARRLSEDGKPILQFDYSHASEQKAAGWIKGLELSEDGNALFATVDWTPPAKEAIQNKEWKFSSPTIERNYTDAETGKVYDVVLTGAALTNIPFLKGMKEVALSEETQNKEGVMVTHEEVLAFLETATDEQKAEIAAVVGPPAEMAEPDKEKEEKLEMSEGKILQLSEKVTTLTETVQKVTSKLELAEKENQFMKLVTEGKATPGQKDAFLKNDILAFSENAVHINTENHGSGSIDLAGISTKEQAEDRLIKLAEKYSKENDNMAFHLALSEVQDANPELYKLSEEG